MLLKGALFIKKQPFKQQNMSTKKQLFVAFQDSEISTKQAKNVLGGGFGPTRCELLQADLAQAVANGDTELVAILKGIIRKLCGYQGL